MASDFGDRLVLHADASPGVISPVRMLGACSVVNTTTIQCPLPANITGTLMRLYLGWAVVLPSGVLALPSLLAASPLFRAGGAPLTLSFFLPTLSPMSGQRFAVSEINTRTVPFTGWTPQSVPSGFDTSPTKTAVNNGVLNFPAVAQIPETIYFDGEYLVTNLASLQVYISDVRTITLPCPVSTITTSWMLCTVMPLPLSTPQALHVPFMLWDTASMVVFRTSSVEYSYLSVPIIYGIYGCSGSAFEEDAARYTWMRLYLCFLAFLADVFDTFSCYLFVFSRFCSLYIFPIHSLFICVSPGMFSLLVAPPLAM